MKIKLILRFMIAFAVLMVNCSSGGTSETEDQTSADLTTTEQSEAMTSIVGMMTLSNLNLTADAEANLSDLPPAVLYQTDMGDPCIDLSSDLCGVYGAAMICMESLGGTYSGLDFVDCANMYSSSMFTVFNGSTTMNGTTRRFGGGAYDYFRVRMYTDEDPDGMTCTVTGSSTYTVLGENSVDTEYSTTYTCPSSTITHTGGITSSLNNSHLILDGTARFAFSNGRTVICVYAEFDVTTATCADLAAACDLPESSCN